MYPSLCSNAYDDVTDFEINFTKRQKFRYLENETLFFLQIIKIITHQGLLYDKK